MRRRYRAFLFSDVPMPKRTRDRRRAQLQEIENGHVHEGQPNNLGNNNEAAHSDEIPELNNNANNMLLDDENLVNNQMPEDQNDAELVDNPHILNLEAVIENHPENLEENHQMLNVEAVIDNHGDDEALVNNYQELNVGAVIDNHDIDNPPNNVQHQNNDQRIPVGIPDDNEEDEVVYDGANITKKQADLLIMSYALRFHLSNEALEKLLALINCFTPQPVLPSLYIFLKTFPDGLSSVRKHYYCKSCEKIVEFAENNESMCECLTVNTKKALDRQEKFFLTTSVAKRIQALLSDNQIYSELNTAADFSDVRSGKILKSLEQGSHIDKDDITLQFNTDGASVFHTSKIGSSLWPIQVAINELPYQTRRNNIILAGLWFGHGSPKMEIFLREFVDEMKELHSDGVEVKLANGEIKIVRCHLVIGTLDSVARPKVAEMIQFNGHFGCHYCLNEGRREEKGKGYIRVYDPYVGELRTEDHILECAARATPTNPVNGVKGFSILMELPTFNVVRSLVPDYLHGIVIGVVPACMEIWCNSSNKQKAWYLGNKLEKINERLGAATPTSEITRLPSAIEKRGTWKGSEWRVWLVYYSIVILKDLLPDPYYQHWLLLVFGARLLLQNSISLHDIQQAKKAFHKFVKGTERLYGVEHLSFNMHLLLHMPSYVRAFGALWASSTFTFEHGNGVLLKYFTGTRSVTRQIFWTYECLSYIRNEASSTFNGNFNYAPAGVLASELINRFRYVKKFVKSQGVTLLGSGTPYNVTDGQKLQILSLLREQANIDLADDIALTANVFSRFICNEMLLCGSSYCRDSQRDNSVVELIDDTLIEIIALLNVSWGENLTYPIVMAKRLSTENYSLVDDPELSIKAQSFVQSVQQDDQTSVYLCSQIYNKCVTFKMFKKVFVIPIINIFERD